MLGGVAEKIEVGGALCHGCLDVPFGFGRVGDFPVADAAGGEEKGIDMDGLHKADGVAARHGDGAVEHFTARAEIVYAALREADIQVRVIGDDGQLRNIAQIRGKKTGGAGCIHKNSGSRTEKRRRFGADAFFLRDSFCRAEKKRNLVGKAFAQHRAAEAALQNALFLQRLQVAANGGGAAIQKRAQLFDG